MRESDLDYYRHRLAEEESRAAESQCPAVRSAHRDLARLYRERLMTEGRSFPQLAAANRVEQAVGA
jgi:hypothetical protein